MKRCHSIRNIPRDFLRLTYPERGDPTVMFRFYTLVERILIRLMTVPSARAFIHRHVPPIQSRYDGQRQLLVDVSVIQRDDARTGIQRVVRALLQQLMKHPPVGYRIVPIFATRKQTYRYAPDFLTSPAERSTTDTGETALLVQPGDIFLGLDLSAHLLPMHHLELIRWKRSGVRLHFVVYDLLPVLNPSWFNARTSRNITRWLRTLAIFADNLICISNVVKDDVTAWMKTRYGLNGSAPTVKTIPLGADIAASVPSRGLPPNIEQLLEVLRSKPSVLMVGTLEPRKGHAQVLAAFENLWQKDLEINLVIVGRPGWKTEILQLTLRSHHQSQKHLFWFENASDELLDLLYAASTGVMVASHAEGYGLPLVEALNHNKPVLARDLPVLREIASGDLVTFFQENNNETLARIIFDWLAGTTNPRSDEHGQFLTTWRESARCMALCVSGPCGDA
jgi:glycosyltransferase involved in cell wall biosynthesis